MARADLIKKVEEEIRRHHKDIGQLTGLGDSVVFDVTYDSNILKEWLYKWFKEKWQAAPKGKSYRMWKLKELGDKEQVWGRIISELNTELAKSPTPLGNIKLWKNNKPKDGGAYWLGRQNVKRTNIIIRYVRSKGQGPNEGLMAMHAGKYKDLIYNRWLEHIEEVMGKGARKTHYGRVALSQSQGTYKASTKGRLRTIRGEEVVKNPFTRARSSRNLKSKYPGIKRPRYGPMQIGHKTTKGAMALRLLAEESPEFTWGTSKKGFTISMLDIVKELENNLHISIVRKKDRGRRPGAKEFGGRFTWLIKAQLETNYAGSEATDLTNLIEQSTGTGKLSVHDAIDKVLERIEKQKGWGRGFLNASGSPSAKDEVVGDTVFKIVSKIKKKNRKAKVITKPNVRPFNTLNEKIDVKRAKKKKTIGKAAATIKLAGKRGKKPREERREQPERGASELLKLERVINKRLPAEVRRNMGRPALINQTGRFSNSVKLESLRETGGGISGEYSYMLSPYETFENTGPKKWPIGYNPKPLITMSIRKLAMQYTDAKFTQLRRT